MPPMLALMVCGGRSVEVNTLGCGPGGEGSIPSAHPIFHILEPVCLEFGGSNLRSCWLVLTSLRFSLS